ncbi:molybdate ABC transporter substrate-binding protein [Pseudaestuariivita rosea]|uniref:molybdate ABC transporter substrate-binding protein n=1 Tax=Pseudaestuariivita rosea TaxID=2763263 RepID=UPI001ABBA68A|nr:molybdate ABC transporter substrate-binding protein [Pseudaestuariivita rosea]
MRRLFLTLVAFVSLSGPASARDDIIVFAAASLKTALDQVVSDWNENSDQKVLVSYGGSSSMARQIEYGAPASVFLSANVDWMHYLQDRGAIQPDTRREILSNRLVIVAPAPAGPIAITDQDQIISRLGQGRFAIPITRAVPAGQYGKAALEATGLWPIVADHLAETDNVRTALALVARGAAPLGLVYRTDAMVEPRVAIVIQFPADTHPAITYAAALTTVADPGADAFLDHMSSDSALQHFETHGFIVLQ